MGCTSSKSTLDRAADGTDSGPNKDQEEPRIAETSDLSDSFVPKHKHRAQRARRGSVSPPC